MNLCTELHEIVNSAKRFVVPFDENVFPQNGIYILFEKDEKGHNGDRIVRVGINLGDNRFRKRLRDHFIKEKKDNSIFRKNIGRALLNEKKDGFLEYWELDLNPRKNWDKYHSSIDMSKQIAVENDVTNYINNSFSLVILEETNREARKELESNLVSTVSFCKQCGSSSKWLGIHSPVAKIRLSGLWQVQGLYKTPLSARELKIIEKKLIKT